MKRFFLVFLAAVGLMLTGCNMNELVSVNHAGDVISFFPKADIATKGVDVTTANLTSFTVEAFNTGTVTSPYMSAVNFTGGSGTFASATPYYWPEGNLDFYAYSQGAAEGQVSKTNFQTFVITPSATPAAQVDFVYAGNMNMGKGGSDNGAIALNFRHAESKVKVQVKNTAPNLKFVIDAWQVGYLDEAGTFTFTTGTDTDGAGTLGTAMWSGNTDATAAKSYTMSLTSPVTIAANSSSATALNNGNAAPNDGMILIPQSTSAATAYASASASAAVNGSYVAVKMKILNRDNDAVIYSDGAGNTAWAIWPVAFAWEPGKAYTYTIDLVGGGYYLANHDSDADLDPILEGAVISFASVTVDEFAAQTPVAVPADNRTLVSMEISVDDVCVGDNAVAVVIMSDDYATGNVTLTFNNTTYSEEVEDGICMICIPIEMSGIYTITGEYSGDVNFRPCSATSNEFEATKVTPEVTLNFSGGIEGSYEGGYHYAWRSGQTIHVDAYVPFDATGTVRFVFDGQEYTRSVSEGVATFEITAPVVTYGTDGYTIEAQYSGNAKYNNSDWEGKSFCVIPAE